MAWHVGMCHACDGVMAHRETGDNPFILVSQFAMCHNTQYLSHAREPENPGLILGTWPH